MKTRALVLDGLFVALSLAVHQAEAMLPPLAPGVKPGLANIFPLVVWRIAGFGHAAAISALRVLIGGAISGFGVSFICSASGALGALLILYLARRDVGTVPVSMFQAAAFNMAQLAAVCFILRDIRIALSYFPILIISALITGYTTGWLAGKVEKLIPRQR